MRNVDMVLICLKCSYQQSIYYADGSSGCGCLAHDMESLYPVDIRNMERCPKGRDEE